ncbi:unnamed protein product [Rotaria sp. Silwood2]|nr:unnamed protein product [Rotaria sp. Silwood2]
MISKLEILLNEIFFNIFSHLLWNDILTSFWSLNKRFNSLICLNFSINNCGIIINKTSLSYKIFLSKLFSLISNCSSLINSIRHIHLDGTCPYNYEFINKNRYIYNYSNLKSLILDRFYLSELLINNLCSLIQGQLNKLTMILDEDVFTVFESEKEPLIWVASQKIRLHYACFIEYLIEHTPNIERLVVYLKTPWNRYQLSDLASEKFEQSNTISSNKKFRAEKLKYLILKSTVDYDGQLYYLKWFFNNLNSVENIKIRLKIDGTCEKNPIIYGSIVDANFIWKYLMSDTIINLIHFDFYIVSKCKLLSNYSERTINSFKNHSFFVERHWTNVKCLFDEVKFYQHLSSSPSTINNLSEYFYDLM